MIVHHLVLQYKNLSNNDEFLSFVKGYNNPNLLVMIKFELINGNR